MRVLVPRGGCERARGGQLCVTARRRRARHEMKALAHPLVPPCQSQIHTYDWKSSSLCQHQLNPLPNPPIANMSGKAVAAADKVGEQQRARAAQHNTLSSSGDYCPPVFATAFFCLLCMPCTLRSAKTTLLRQRACAHAALTASPSQRARRRALTPHAKRPAAGRADAARAPGRVARDQRPGQRARRRDDEGADVAGRAQGAGVGACGRVFVRGEREGGGNDNERFERRSSRAHSSPSPARATALFSSNPTTPPPPPPPPPPQRPPSK